MSNWNHWNLSVDREQHYIWLDHITAAFAWVRSIGHVIVWDENPCKGNADCSVCSCKAFGILYLLNRPTERKIKRHFTLFERYLVGFRSGWRAVVCRCDEHSHASIHILSTLNWDKRFVRYIRVSVAGRCVVLALRSNWLLDANLLTLEWKMLNERVLCFGYICNKTGALVSFAWTLNTYFKCENILRFS